MSAIAERRLKKILEGLRPGAIITAYNLKMKYIDKHGTHFLPSRVQLGMLMARMDGVESYIEDKIVYYRKV